MVTGQRGGNISVFACTYTAPSEVRRVGKLSKTWRVKAQLVEDNFDNLKPNTALKMTKLCVNITNYT